MTAPTTTAPISLSDVVDARTRIAPYLTPTPVRTYPLLDAAVGHGIRLFVKHENHQPTASFKVRNGLSFMTALGPEQWHRGVVAASTGNHGQGLAYAAALMGASVTIFVPRGNNPEKNAAMESLGATVVEHGADFDEALTHMQDLAAREGRLIAHSVNDVNVLAGAGTMTLELVEQARELDALIIAVGGGSQAVGAITVARALAPRLAIYGVGAAGAPAQHDSWHARMRLTTPRVDTFAEGVATRATYDMTVDVLREGLTDFITVTDAEIADAMRTVIASTHSLVEGSGAMGFAALRHLGPRLAGKRVAIVFCGGNVAMRELRMVMNAEI